MPGMPYKIKSIVTRKFEGVKHFHYYLCRRLGGGMEIIMAKRKESPPKAVMKEMIRDFLSEE